MFKVLLAWMCGYALTVAAPSDTFGFSGINEFSLRLLDNIVAVQDGNCAVSPISIWNLLSLLTEGAAGNTFQELMVQLNLPKDPKLTRNLHQETSKVLQSTSSDVVLYREGAMFIDSTLMVHREFCEIAVQYGTDVFNVDTLNTTQLAFDINYYICLKTDGKIQKTVTSETLENLRLLLVDVIYFQANWTHPFDTSQTKEEAFYDQHGRTIGNVNMMYQKAPNQATYLAELSATALELTYGKDKKYSMIILLPTQNGSLKKLVKTLSTTSLDLLLGKLQKSGEPTPIDCYVPRFSISSDTDLQQPLKYMGLNDIFDSSRAELQGISDTPLFVSKTLQKVEFEVTEQGTTAAAATVFGLEERILGQRVEVNSPFVYLLVERQSNVLLFAGVYVEPSLF